MSDPAKGRIKYTHEQFKKGWYRKGEDYGVLLAVEPTADFKDSKAEKEQKRVSIRRTPYRDSLFRASQTSF